MYSQQPTNLSSHSELRTVNATCTQLPIDSTYVEEEACHKICHTATTNCLGRTFLHLINKSQASGQFKAQSTAGLSGKIGLCTFRSRISHRRPISPPTAASWYQLPRHPSPSSQS